MIDTELIRRRFVGVRHVAPYVVPALCDEVDALRAELAAEKARAERLAAVMNTIPPDEDYWLCESAEGYRDARVALLPGDLGEVAE